ncbi:MAG TPA: hypothetical protein VND91_02720, partial [Candidatus Saccharimonadia bacterium]|nr:hypothetical protein [Candidatus Saccharimonadia bacterium]
MRDLAPWLAALAGTALTLLLFWPGYTSVDSLHQYRQALAGSYDNVHPPLFAFAWRQLDRLVTGSGAMHALLVAGFWTGLARTLWEMPMPARARVAAFAAIGLWPPVLLIVAHVWKDVAMAAALLLACGACLRWRRHARRRDLTAALAWLALAVAMRHNAWPAALPFVALLFPARDRPLFPARRSLRGGAPLAAIALAGALAIVPWLVEAALGAERKRLWPTVALWDLAAVSIATGEVRLPREVAPTVTLADLEAHYRSWSCVPLYESGKIRLALNSPYTDADSAAVDRAWLSAVRDAPGPYLAHRGRVLAGLYLAPPSDAPRELVYVPAHHVESP